MELMQKAFLLGLEGILRRAFGNISVKKKGGEANVLRR